jgi:serine protease Do
MTTDLERDLAALATTLHASTVAVRSARGAGSGSGVIWSADGTIVTNAHVARTAAVEIVLPDGQMVLGRVERRDERRDLAAIRVAAGSLTPARIGDPANLRPGEFVAAFGHPLGVPNVLSTGIVYARHRTGSGAFLRSDVKLAPGNSGGALADAAGAVIGIASMVSGDLALSIAADTVADFLAGDNADRHRLGVRLAPAHVSGELDAYAVLAIEPGSRAEAAGLLVGDLILARDPAAVAALARLHVLRGGVALTLDVTARPRNEAAAAA